MHVLFDLPARNCADKIISNSLQRGEHPIATVAANTDMSFTKTDDIEEPSSPVTSVKPPILITAEVFQNEGSRTEVSVAIIF